MSVPTVFISYAHKDGMEFTQRFAFALELYADTYWDQRVQTGEFPPQLYEEIERRDFFVFVMSAYSLREGGWCRRELEHAQKHNNGGIVLAKIHPAQYDESLIQDYTYGDFTEDFEQGFRRLTGMILGQPYSSWEYLGRSDDQTVLDSLRYARVPGIIAKALAEWVLVEKVWPQVEERIGLIAQRGVPLVRGTPLTPQGMYQQCDPVAAQLRRVFDQPGLILLHRAKHLLASFVDELSEVRDEDHRAACAAATVIVDDTFMLLQRHFAAHSAVKLAALQKHFYFEVADKIRELVTAHSRRSRYLY